MAVKHRISLTFQLSTMSLQIQHTAGPKALHYDNLPDRIAPQMTVVVIAASQTYIAV